MTTPKLMNRREEIVTHAFGHILNSSEAAREALSHFLLTCGVDIGEIDTVETLHVSKPEGGTPDLVARDATGTERLLLEAKINANLTQHQPVTYLQRLPKYQPSALLFAAPPDVLDGYWEELQRRVAAEEGLDLINKHEAPELRWFDVDGHRRLILASWRLLFDRIAAQAASAVAQTADEIHQLQGIAGLHDPEPPGRGPLPPDFPRSLTLLYALVDDAVERLVSMSLAEIPGGAYRPTVHRDYSVRYMTFCGVPNASFGVYFRDWRTYHHIPLRFALHDCYLTQGVVDALLKESFQSYRDETYPYIIYIPIHLNGDRYETLLDSLTEQIARIAAPIEPGRT